MLWTEIFSLGFFLILIFSSFFVSQTQGCGNCCSSTTYKSINESRRSTKAVWKAGEKPFCDRGLRWGWYRFTSYTGGKIPEWKVPEDHCGTQAPVWLNGKHPEIKGENVVREACIHVFGDGCWERFDINITNCGGYFVYYLRPPYYCAVAYCAGEKEPCPYGKEGVYPDCFDPPKEFSSENLGVPVISFMNDENVEVTLLCKVKVLNGIQNWKNVSYKIEWFAEGTSLHEEKICGNLPAGKVNAKSCPGEAGEIVSKLSGKKYKIGQRISCFVSAKFTTSPKNVWSKPKTVIEPFFAGIQFYPRTTRLNFITHVTCGLSISTITITPTIPARQNDDNLWPKISFWLPSEIQLLDQSQCDIELRGTQNITLRIKATCPAIGARGGLKAIIPYIANLHSKVWNTKVNLPTIWVTVIKPSVTIHTCRSYGDPHFNTLDWDSGYYHFMGLGDYIMYSNTERNFEVHVRHWACNWGQRKASCTCGVVLRDHNDVIEISCCNAILESDTTTPLTLRIRSKKCLAPGISIKNRYPGTINGEYEVLFPSGSKVVIKRGRRALDVTIETPRATDASKEKGLCMYNGPRSVTVETEGYKSRLTSSESYFDTLPPHVKDDDVQYSKACVCFNGGSPDCGNVFTFAFPTLASTTLSTISPRDLCDRQKRDLHYSDDATEEDFQLFKEVRQLRPRLRRETQIGPFSRENASRYCSERISETKIGKLCAKLGVDVQSLVDTCSDDVVYTGDLSFATGNAALLIDECGELGARNLSKLGNYSSQETPTVDDFVGQIAGLLCPNDCTFNGKCVNGSCICNKGFTAEDCSTSIFQKPVISRLQGDGLCDRRKRPCKKVTVFGTHFLNSTNLTCHVKEFKVVNGSWTPNNIQQRYPGIMTDLVLVDCYLPESPVTQGYFHETDQGTPAAGLSISVSNDGARQSEENLTFISYDSACMNCSILSGCLLKSNSCFINRYCFAPNETNPIDWCYQCLPEVSANSWTKRQANLPPQFSPVVEHFAVFQETLEITIDVVDPEGMPVTVSLENGSPNKALIVDNVLIWNATNDATSHFYLKATDACQATSHINITVSLVACQCQNNGSCVPHPNRPRGSGYYECDCVPGFTGENCDINVDDCQSYPCFRGQCIDGLNKYTCICDPGYVGSNCDADYDDCRSSPCIHGKCTDYTGAYKCTCDPGYSGPNCMIDIDECESSPCKQGHCVDQINNYTCQCQEGYAGRDCEVEIDECQSSPCIHGTCLDMVNDYTCVCPTGYTGKRCEENINDCLSTPCVNGTCIDLVNNYTCNCDVGFSGLHCDIAIKNCTIDSCYPNVTCFKTSETISCGPCPTGLSGNGKNCEDIDYCTGANYACSNGGSCVDGISNYSCSCLAGYTGDHCERDIDDCVNHTCSNGGSCVDGVNNYSCNCLVGFTGSNCEQDIDECVNYSCSNGGSCKDGVNSFSCNCLLGFTGSNCETDIDDCVNHLCSNGGSCEDGVNSYSCNCLLGFTGSNCETDIDDCVNHTCSNGGSCEDLVNSYACNCAEGYIGDYCETDIDHCINHTCQNGGSCVDGIHNYSCKCSTGYTGGNCETGLASSSVSRHATTTHTLTSSKSSTETVTLPTSILTRTPAAASSISQEIRITRVTSFNGVSATSSSAVTSFSSSDKESTTANTQPTTQQPETTLVIELSLQQTWNKDLENKSSQAFKELSRTLEILIFEQYSQEDNFVGVQILSFRPGSVVAQFQLLFKIRLQEETSLTPLKTAIQDGKLGPFTVDPESLKIVKDVEEPTKEERGKVPYPIIIGVSCGGIFILAVVSIYLIRHCHRRKMDSRGRNSRA